MARSNRRRSTRRKDRGGTSSIWPYVLGAVAAIGLLVAAIFYRNQTEHETAVNVDTLCPLDTGPVAMAAILFDLTDPLTLAQSKQLLARVEKEIADAPIGTQFTMGVVSETPESWGATAPLCKPRSGHDVSTLTQNVRLVETRYEKRFMEPLHANIESMISAHGANKSPIMEALQTLIADTSGFLTFAGPRKVIIVSDLLQNSESMSFYAGDDWQSFATSPQFARLNRTLEGVDIIIFEVPRVVSKIKDPRVIEDFWLHYFDVQGARVPTVKTIGDL
ncbi:MAG: hypothetical protein JWS10_1092 [Cypionkella sp.]|uniref:hypothetical protein n=1 Tax=Cypionkella sp. TaxID=2811411 RepID=UPI00260307D9|nr:hypothetical protein [Cypionkella sp.]MDB5658477.1 hypothetical protein [Cypionkella sp.]